MGESASRFYQDALGLQVGAVKFAAIFERLGHKVRGAEK
jgi:hypothetical protein